VSRGQITVIHDLHDDIRGKDVLVVEDIVDSGHTMRFLHAYLAPRTPASVRVCTLLDKPQHRQVPVSIDYCGFTIADVFVVGYGLDVNEQYRHLPDLCILE
jgi:hypoxanthine phosphoribosyltransferase